MEILNGSFIYWKSSHLKLTSRNDNNLDQFSLFTIKKCISDRKLRYNIFSMRLSQRCNTILLRAIFPGTILSKRQDTMWSVTLAQVYPLCVWQERWDVCVTRMVGYLCDRNGGVCLSQDSLKGYYWSSFRVALDGWPKRTVFNNLSSFRTCPSHINLSLIRVLESGVKPKCSYNLLFEIWVISRVPRTIRRQFLWKNILQTPSAFRSVHSLEPYITAVITVA